jgi:hypothetical protein
LSFTPRHPLLHYSPMSTSLRSFVDHQLPSLIKSHYSKYEHSTPTRPFPFGVGDKVKILTTTIHGARTHLQPHWAGPCTITNTYPSEGSLRARTPHSTQPRLYLASHCAPWHDPPPTPVDPTKQPSSPVLRSSPSTPHSRRVHFAPCEHPERTRADAHPHELPPRSPQPITHHHPPPPTTIPHPPPSMSPAHSPRSHSRPTLPCAAIRLPTLWDSGGNLPVHHEEDR